MHAFVLQDCVGYHLACASHSDARTRAYTLQHARLLSGEQQRFSRCEVANGDALQDVRQRHLAYHRILLHKPHEFFISRGRRLLRMEAFRMMRQQCT